jgi:hypothetical protein
MREKMKDKGRVGQSPLSPLGQVGDSNPPGKSSVRLRSDSEKLARKAEKIDHARARARQHYPWAKAQAYFLLPVTSAPGNDPRWPRLSDVAKEFGIPLSTVEQHSARYGWLKMQADEEDKYWMDQNDKMRSFVARRMVQLQGAVFANAGRIAREITSKLNGLPDPETICRLARANREVMETGYLAAGLVSGKSPSLSCTPVSIPEKKESKAFDSLWGQIQEARLAVMNADPSQLDYLRALEEQSTLPSHLSASSQPRSFQS